ncbi:Torsin-like protein [Eumeta japonica]|uniref:Torsin-like protein n=1 Tax=Eumeta variegata TaxID=151549 RepID=A0A4C1XXG2_EUMVA|nr:Torsin-like protein [Eumeta japonica]
MQNMVVLSENMTYKAGKEGDVRGVAGGLENSSTIAQHMIDHYIPFLPLEQQHVEKCALAEFKAHGITEVTDVMALVH